MSGIRCTPIRDSGRITDAEVDWMAHCLMLWFTRQPMKPCEIATILGYSRSWVWSIEQSALAKIRAAMEAAA